MNDIKKVVMTGPESTGKTTLAKALGTHFDEPWVPEFARKYIDQLGRNYVEKDLVKIAHGQILEEEQLLEKAQQLLFCDTDMVTIKVWSAVKYQRIEKFIVDQIEQRHYDLYFLCQPDIPWEPDPQREASALEQRIELYDLYKKELHFYGKRFVELHGTKKERFQKAILHISSLFA